MAHLGAHFAFRSRWQKTDDELCRHSMSFILHKAIRNDFFQSYLYLLEKIPLDYHLFRSMTHALSEQHFKMYKEVENWVSE